jgi:hypothetical protein
MHVRCEFTDETRTEIKFTITSENSREENEINLFWSLLSQKKMKDVQKQLDGKHMTGLKFVFEHVTPTN